MHLSLKTPFCISLLSISVFASLEGTSGFHSLTAVTRRSHLHLSSRDVDFTPGWNPEFHYVDENSLGTDSPFAASLGFSSKFPVLALEDVEAHLDGIRCSKAAIEISFRSGRHCERAREAWGGLESFLVVTSHQGCNYDGERSPYRVSSVTFIEGQPTAILSVQVMDWKDTFHSMTVSFGISEGYTPGHLRRHGSLRKRLVDSAASAVASPTLSGGPSRSLPVAPTDAPSATSVSQDLSFSELETQIFPPNFPGVSLVGPHDWAVSCKNCSAKGSVELTYGTFTMAVNSSVPFADAINFIHPGSATLTVSNFAAHIELETAVKPSQELLQFNVNLLAAPIPISPFQIPGIAAVGAFFDPLLIASVSISEAFNFTYGFDLSVPNQSFVTIDVGNITNSSTAGFDKTVVKALPFQATAGDIGLTFSAALRLQILVGIQLLNGLGHADVDFFLDLSQVSVTIEQLTNVAKNCVPSNATNNIEDAFGHIFGNLTHVSPNVGLDVGVGLTAALELEGKGTSTGSEWTIASTKFPLPTACLSYDQRDGTFAPASDPPTKTTRATNAAESKTEKKGDGARAGNPFEGMWKRWHAYAVVLMAVLNVL